MVGVLRGGRKRGMGREEHITKFLRGNGRTSILGMKRETRCCERSIQRCRNMLHVQDVSRLAEHEPYCPGEGTLLVNPLFKLTMTYYLLTPFFSLQNTDVGSSGYLDKGNWELDLIQNSV